MREKILSEIRRLAMTNGGKPLGVRLFERETGIRKEHGAAFTGHAGGDAVREAGFEPNAKQGKLAEKFFLTKLADACRHYKKFPTAMELRMYQKKDAEFPNVKSITRHFGSLTHVPGRLMEWVNDNGKADLIEILGAEKLSARSVVPTSTKEGIVYLIQSGSHYKIGRSDDLERRVKEIRIALPEAASLIHTIRTDDPAGIEAYWHRRFAVHRANGEWFKLERSDVAAFKRRKYQ